MVLRWQLSNVWPCHRTCHDAANHLDKYEATLIKTQGQEFVDDLKTRGYQYHKDPSEEEITEIIEDLTLKLKEYGN